MTRRILAPVVGTALVALAVLAAAPVAAQKVAAPKEEPTRYSAFAVDLSGYNMATSTATVDIVVNHWATETESARVRNVLSEQGASKLLELMRDLPRVGGISTPGSIGFDIRHAQRTIGTGGAEEVLLLTDRPIGMWEASVRPRSIDYPFTVVNFKINSAGQGEGTLTAAARLGIDRFSKRMILENFTDQPIRLNQVKREKK